jgi:uncharacterized iron-regulated protein
MLFRRFVPCLKYVSLTLLGALLLTACSLFPERLEKQSDAIKPLLLTDHVLAGKIWDVTARQFVNKQHLAEHIVNSDYLLLGETHDNPQHHQGHAWAITQLGSGGHSAAVAFEMISQQQGLVIAGRQFDSAESLIAGLNHIKVRWNYKRFYEPVFVAAINADYTVLPANFDRKEISLLARKGETELSQEIKTLLTENALPAEQVVASRKEIEGSHCGMINEEMTEAMMLVQRAKDAQMTRAMLNEQKVDVQVLVAGSGHVRRDRGVPFYLQRYASDKNILSVAWLEVESSAIDVQAYAERWGEQLLPFDFVLFTPRVDRTDPCEKFRQHMKNKKG